MQKFWWLFFTIIMACGCFTAKQNPVHFYNENCIHHMQYFTLRHKIQGEIIATYETDILSGRILTGSVAIIKTLANDTLRIIYMGNKKFTCFDTVEISPVKWAAKIASISVPNDKPYCFIKKTCMGEINKKHTLKLDDSEKNQKDWVYYNLDHEITGRIMVYYRSPALCGGFAWASSTIIKTNTGDTVRVVQLCNNSREFKKSDSVKVEPAERPVFHVGVFSGEFDREIKRTCYGIVSKI